MLLGVYNLHHSFRWKWRCLEVVLVQLFAPEGALHYMVAIAGSVEKRTRREDERLQSMRVFEGPKARVAVAGNQKLSFDLTSVFAV